MSDLVLDHVGVVVDDLTRARAAFERLGFQLTPLSYHRGPPKDGQPGALLGSGNRCAILAQGYIEVIGVTDPAKNSPIAQSLAKYQGTHTVAFRVPNSVQAYADAGRRKAGALGAIHLERSAAWGKAGEERPAVFSNVYFDDARYPESRPLLIEHITPDVIWQECFVDQPNGAVALLGITIMADDLPDAVARYRTLLDAPAVRHDAHRQEIKLGYTTVLLCDGAGLDRWFSGLTPIRPGFTAGFTLGTRNLDATRAYLEGQGVTPVQLGRGVIGVAPADACGTAIVFQQI